MPSCKSLVSTLLLASALALLASVLIAPIQTSGFAATGPDCLRRHFSLPPAEHTTRVSATIATEVIPQVNALRSEEEEQDGADALDEPRISSRIPSSFRKVSDRQSIALRSILSHYPLRC